MKAKIMRLDRWLSNHGVGSRKEVGAMIRNGQVQVNGEVVRKPGVRISEKDKVVLDGEQISLKEYVYYMMNKPQDVLCATEDNYAKTVLDILPEQLKRPGLFPAGRLDKDTEGFVLITNDGDFAHRVLSPKNRVPKTYIAKIDKKFEHQKLIDAFKKGVQIGEGETTSPAELKVLEDLDNPTVELVIYEGMFHQVKRMFLAFNLQVIHLKREKIGSLVLDSSLELGQTREITEQEKGQITDL